jgi:hypothetical protein
MLKDWLMTSLASFKELKLKTGLKLSKMLKLSLELFNKSKVTVPIQKEFTTLLLKKSSNTLMLLTLLDVFLAQKKLIHFLWILSKTLKPKTGQN